MDNNQVTITKCPEWVGEKWASGQSADKNTLIVQLPMNLDIQVTDKDGKKKTYEQLAQLGSRFGGVEIGTDAEGRRIMANISIYRKPIAVSQSSRNTAVGIG